MLGPAAEEVAAEKLSYLTFSGVDEEMTRAIASHFKTSLPKYAAQYRYLWGTVLQFNFKNIYALGAGIAHGLEYGDNFPEGSDCQQRR